MSYHTSYDSMHALFSAEVTIYHKLQLIFFKKYYILFFEIYFYGNSW